MDSRAGFERRAFGENTEEVGIPGSQEEPMREPSAAAGIHGLEAAVEMEPAK
jgi:hypothetical protein